MKTTLRAALTIVAFWALQVHPISASAQGSWQATLEGRDLDGDSATIEAYYDKALNITWLDSSPVEPLAWDDAKNWVANLSINGITGWRLPALQDTGEPGCNYALQGTDCGYNVQTNEGNVVYSEFASLYYDTLGNKGYYSASGEPQVEWGLQNSGPFKHLKSGLYWLNSEHYYWLGNSGRAWEFATDLGYQDAAMKMAHQNVLAVHVGDIGAPIPEPSSLLLMTFGLACLGGKWRLTQRPLRVCGRVDR